MSRPIVTVTGGSGFVGQLIRPGLEAEGYDVRVFDRLRGPFVDALRRRHLGTSTSGPVLSVARKVRGAQLRAETELVRRRLLRPSWDDVLDVRAYLADRLRGHYAVVHLAGIPHPHQPGTVPQDFRRINFDGAVNVFEAARMAGVRKFVFASSAQVYGINNPVRVDQFPILETNYCPTLEDGHHAYGVLKRDVERYLDEAAAGGDIQAIALRMEFPGFRSEAPVNLYVSTSVQNTIAGFAAALNTRADFASEAFNLADPHVEAAIVDVQAYLRTRWPGVPNHTTGNESLLSTEKARRLLGYRPQPGGSYYDPSLVW